MRFLPHDQRQEDGGALVFETEFLGEDIEIFGTPTVEMELSASEPVAMVAVRLSDISPDDKATRVTDGLLNLTHREGHVSPRPLKPGKRYKVQVPLNGVAQRFPEGHRLRLSISASYWPLAWPPPKPVQLTIYSGCSTISLPVRPENEDIDLEIARARWRPTPIAPMNTARFPEKRDGSANSRGATGR